MNGGRFNVVDLFSGAGGMSVGFRRHPCFSIVGAADAEMGKPSAGSASLQCNGAYLRNLGVAPVRVDLRRLPARDLRAALGLAKEQSVHVLAACPPCTGFSRANPLNHLRDDPRNGLVGRIAEFAISLGAGIVVMENARELIRGNFAHHCEWFKRRLESHGYEVRGSVHTLSRFGLPQIRERAIVIAARRRPLWTLEGLWDGWRVREDALTVRRAFDSIPRNATGLKDHPRLSTAAVRRRIAAIPRDGGSWIDLLGRDDAEELLTGAMKRVVARGRFGSYPDVYGRMAWDRPAPTIKRECSHVGNGRYAHPEENRLCSVREMAALQGFPADFVFEGASLSNTYRHIGDAVPPLISHQIAHLCHAMLTECAPPAVERVLLSGTHLTPSDLIRETESAMDPSDAVEAIG